MKYERPSFIAGVGSKAYRDNWDNIFGPNSPEKKAERAAAKKAAKAKAKAKPEDSCPS